MENVKRFRCRIFMSWFFCITVRVQSSHTWTDTKESMTSNLVLKRALENQAEFQRFRSDQN